MNESCKGPRGRFRASFRGVGGVSGKKNPFMDGVLVLVINQGFVNRSAVYRMADFFCVQARC